MMKKLFAILLLFIVYSSTCLATDNEVAPNWPWQGFTSKHPTGPFDEPWAKMLPPRPSPSGPPVNPSPSPILQCFEDYRIERGCYLQILSSFFTRKLDLAPECCKVVSAISEDCVGTIFARFNNPFFATLLHKHCSTEGH